MGGRLHGLVEYFEVAGCITKIEVSFGRYAGASSTVPVFPGKDPPFLDFALPSHRGMGRGSNSNSHTARPRQVYLD